MIMTEEIIGRLKEIYAEHGATPPSEPIVSLMNEVGKDNLLLALLEFPSETEEERMFVTRVKDIIKGALVTKEEEKRVEKPPEKPPEAAGVIRLKIAASGRGAVFKLKRAFWAAVSKEKRDAERSGQYWKEFAGKIVQKLNEEGASDKPVRIVLHYNIVENAIRPVRADIEVYEKVKEFTVE